MFKSGVVPMIIQSIAREHILVEEERKKYATELLDTYNKFGSKYVNETIDESIKHDAIKKVMKRLTICYPLLSSLISDISMIYKEQPKREFYLNGKQVIGELKSEVLDKKNYHIDKNLKEKLDNIYNLEFCLRIEAAEELTNLLNTTIYKINNREGELKLDFISNDIACVSENIYDTTQMNSLYFLIGVAKNGQDIITSYEQWTPLEYEILEGEESVINENRAVKELQVYYENSELLHIGSGFPPFVVLRDSLSNNDFWNIKNKDIIDIFRQINMAFTEVRYLQRAGTFGIKYITNATLNKDAPFDVLGVWELNQPDQVPGAIEKRVEVGELKNEARIKELMESIFDMVRMMFVLVGINTDNLRGARTAESAESKEMDREDIKKFLQKKRKIWTLNEDNIFRNIICVYNRDNTNKLPKGLTIKVDFPEIELTAEEMEKKISNWLIMIDNYFKTSIDWIMEENPDLTEEEAKKLYEQNKAFGLDNKMNSEAVEEETPENIEE